MENLKIGSNYTDPANGEIEIVERKGLGHPDSLADMLAKECSRIYSKYCLDNFGCVLHHNFDKLYIGAGCFRYENGVSVMYDKVKVNVNGRASNMMNGEKIDLEALLVPVIKKYLNFILPRLDTEKELEININCTQNTKIPRWFSPKNIDDVPDAKKIFASDTSLCIASSPMTISEIIAIKTEQFFWDFNDEYPVPKFEDIGQDIKVMVTRIQNDINISIGLPVYSEKYKNQNEYETIVKNYEEKLETFLCKIVKDYNLSIEINRFEDGTYRNYSLIKGSCIECGEEGVVGRGNNAQGLISVFRPHTMEAPFGKNERYHTGKVLSSIANAVSNRIFSELNLKNTIFCLAKNKNPLMEPYLIYLSVENELSSDQYEKIKIIIKEEFDENTYLIKIINDNSIF